MIMLVSWFEARVSVVKAVFTCMSWTQCFPGFLAKFGVRLEQSVGGFAISDVLESDELAADIAAVPRIAHDFLARRLRAR
jgi:hypothetical protein